MQIPESIKAMLTQTPVLCSMLQNASAIELVPGGPSGKVTAPAWLIALTSTALAIGLAVTPTPGNAQGFGGPSFGNNSNGTTGLGQVLSGRVAGVLIDASVGAVQRAVTPKPGGHTGGHGSMQGPAGITEPALNKPAATSSDAVLTPQQERDSANSFTSAIKGSLGLSRSNENLAVNTAVVEAWRFVAPTKLVTQLSNKEATLIAVVANFSATEELVRQEERRKNSYAVNGAARTPTSSSNEKYYLAIGAAASLPDAKTFFAPYLVNGVMTSASVERAYRDVVNQASKPAPLVSQAETSSALRAGFSYAAITNAYALCYGHPEQLLVNNASYQAALGAPAATSHKANDAEPIASYKP